MTIVDMLTIAPLASKTASKTILSEIVFIDPAVADYKQLVEGVREGVEVIVLNPYQDSIAQITRELSQRRNINSLHLVAHGQQGQIQLGSSTLSLSTLENYRSALQLWTKSLASQAEILLYGCEVGAGKVGTEFIYSLGLLLGIPIAASSSKVGNPNLGGQWDLDVKTGVITSPLAFNPEVIATYAHVLNLDTTFGTGGKVVTDLGGSTDFANSVTIQSDGKILVAGRTNNGSNDDFALTRYNPDGSLDTTFGSGGIVITPIGSLADSGNSVVIQSNGQIVVAGSSNNGSNDDFALTRYNPNGSLDTTFGTQGKVTTPIGSSADSGNSVVIQSNGKIVVAGKANNGSNDDFALARYNTDGSLDTSFGTQGKVITPIGSLADSGNSVVIQSDGKIVVVGKANNGSNDDLALTRYNADGSLDTSFGTGGKVITPAGSDPLSRNSAVIQSDGKIVVAGNTTNGGNPDFALFRYNTNGSLDTTFGNNGQVITDLTFVDSANSVAIQSNGQIVVAGFSFNGSDSDFALTRYNTNGSLDTTFGTNGNLITDFNNSFDSANSVALQNDGKIVVVGVADGNFALARYVGTLSNQAPTDISLSTASVNENVLIDTAIGTFSTVDPDTGDTFTYSLVTGTGSTDNAAFNIVGDELRINASPDFETKPTYSLRVQSRDQGGSTFEKVLSVSVTNLNEAPTDFTLSSSAIAENVAANSLIGTFNTTDPDTGNTFTYSLVTGTGSTDNAAFTIVNNELRINASPDFETKPAYSLRVQSRDQGGLIFEKALSVAVTDVNENSTTPPLTRNANQIFTLGNAPQQNKLLVTLLQRSSSVVNELGVFRVDNEQGGIINPATGQIVNSDQAAVYLPLALSRSQVVFSALSNPPNGFVSQPSATLSFNPGDRLRFYSLQNITTDELKAGKTPPSNVKLSAIQSTDLGNSSFTISPEDTLGGGTSSFTDLVARVETTSQPLPLGTALQSGPAGEVIDLRGLTGTVQAQFTVNREAAFDNFVGFYKVNNVDGAVTDPLTGSVLNPGQTGYAEAAIRSRVAGIGLTVANQSTATFTGQLEAGSIFAPFIIANGRPEALLDSNPNNNPAVYFTYLAANPGAVDHVRRLGDNIFGFEDLPQGGDFDYNDVTIRINLTRV